MNDRWLVVVFTLIAVLLLVPLPAAAQAQTTAADWSTSPRTAWGDPDLRGIWDFRTITPLERPSELTGRKVLTAEEAAEFEQETLRARDKDLRVSDGITTERDVANAYNQFWWDYGDKLTEDRRTSLIVDPPDGRIPNAAEALARAEMPEAVRREDARRGRAPARSWEDMDLADRCILGFNSGPPMIPSAYNNNVQLFQTPETVVILNEMVHSARVVPLDGQPHLSEDVPQWMGNSRGHWEGSTLVVETTNFLRETTFRGSSANLHLVERFSRVDADTLLYEFTVEDPTTWTRPWSAAIPMGLSEAPMFEYACHEGNYGMTNLLAGSRAKEKAIATITQGGSK